MNLVYAKLFRHRQSRLLPVSRKHHTLFHPHRSHAADGLPGSFLDAVCNHDGAKAFSLAGNIDNGSLIFAGCERDPSVFHQLFISDENFPAIYRNADPFPRNLQSLPYPVHIRLFSIGLPDRSCNGMGGIPLPVGGNFQKLFFGTFFRKQRLNLKFPFGQCPCFIKNNDSHLRNGFHIIAALDQNPDPGGSPDSSEKTKGNGNHQSTGTGDHQKNTGTLNPLCPSASGKKRGKKCQKHRPDGDNGGIVFGKLGNKIFYLGFLAAGILHQLQYLCNGGIIEFF